MFDHPALQALAERTSRIGRLSSALSLMGIRPADYLLTPLIFGFCIAMPLVTFGGIALSVTSVTQGWHRSPTRRPRSPRWMIYGIAAVGSSTWTSNTRLPSAG